MLKRIFNAERYQKIAKAPYYPYLKATLGFVAAFFITFVLYIVIFKSLGFYPFDENGLTTMMLDQRDQYVAYMRAYQDILKNGGSLTYTLGKVIGGDFQSLFTYYLSSPFNLFLVFISSGDIPAFFFYTSIIKMSFASANMVLLAYYERKNLSISHIAFSVAYGLISYAFVYFSNFMYLDGLMLLPLVVLGIRTCEDNRALWLYPLCLGFSLISNWYLGAMICIFSAIFFLVRFSFQKGNLQQRMSFALRFVLFSLLGGFSASFIWISAFTHFSGTKASLSLPSSKWFNWASFFEGLLENNYLSHSTISRNTGYMTMFVSVPSLLFAALYFTNKEYRWWEKAGDGTVLLIYFIVSLSSVLNALFHGGREPTWFPTRYSFIIGFYVCYLANKEASKLENTPAWGSLIPASICAILLPLLCCSKTNDLAKQGEAILYPLSVISLSIFLVALVLVFLYSLGLRLVKNRAAKMSPCIKPIVEIVLLSLTLVSSYRGAKNVVQVNMDDDQYQKIEVYRSDDELSNVFNVVKNSDSSLYRMESTFNRNGSVNTIDNNPLFYSYNGLSHYSSTNKKEISSYMSKIGFHRNGFWERYDAGSTVAINSFLGLKYLIDDSSTSREKPQFIYNSSSKNPFQPIDLNEDSPSKYSYYMNQSPLPLGFAIPSSEKTNVTDSLFVEGANKTYHFNHFEYQNELFYSLCDQVKDESGNKKAIFSPLPISKESLSSGTSVISVDEFGEKTYHMEKGAYISFSFTIPEYAKGNNYYVCEKNLTQNMAYSIDGKSVRLADYWHSGIHSFLEGNETTHTFTIYNSKGQATDVKLVPEIYYEDLDILNEYLATIRKEGAMDLKQVNSISATSYEGTFTLSSEGTKEFVFTLPYESDFEIYIDGQKKETLKRLDVFVGASLEGLEPGAHQVKLVYKDKGLKAGIIISICCVVVFVPAVVFYPWVEKKIFKRKEDSVAD